MGIFERDKLPVVANVEQVRLHFSLNKPRFPRCSRRPLLELRYRAHVRGQDTEALG